VEFMEQDVTAEKACTLFVEGRKLLNEPAFGLAFIEENIEDIIKTDGFVDLPRDCLEGILRSNKLSIDEGDLWNGVDSWAKAECRRLSKKSDGPTKREVLGDTLKLVRFPLMEMTDLCTKVQPANVLSQEELLSLFTYAAAPEDQKPKVTFVSREREGGSSKIIVEEFDWSPKLSNSARIRCEGKRVVSIAPTCNRDVMAIGEVGKNGWNKGLHYWRVNIAQGGCYRRVGVVDGEIERSKFGGDSTASPQWPCILGCTQNSWGVAIGSANTNGEPNVFTGAMNSFPSSEVGLLLDVKNKSLHVYTATGQFIATAFTNIKGKKLRPAIQICHPNMSAFLMPKSGVKPPVLPNKKK